jgi:hypothetical protein
LRKHLRDAPPAGAIFVRQLKIRRTSTTKYFSRSIRPVPSIGRGYRQIDGDVT